MRRPVSLINFMKTIITIIFFGCIFFCEATNLLVRAVLQNPEVSKSWKLHSHGVEGSDESRWHWGVLTNNTNSDALCLAYRVFEEKPMVLDIWMDNTCELFPTGEWAWARKSKEQTLTSPLRYNIRKHGFATNVLEYSLITEVSSGTNYLSHGYVLSWSDQIFFIQHTAQRPISYSFAENVTWHVSRELMKPITTK